MLPSFNSPLSTAMLAILSARDGTMPCQPIGRHADRGEHLNPAREQREQHFEPGHLDPVEPNRLEQHEHAGPVGDVPITPVKSGMVIRSTNVLWSMQCRARPDTSHHPNGWAGSPAGSTGACYLTCA